MLSYFSLVLDDFFKSSDLPSKPGKKTTLSYVEAMTIEMVRKFFGTNKDRSIYNFFREYYLHLFYNLPHRTSWTRLCANLVKYKQKLHQFLLLKLGKYFTKINIVDGFPIPVCNFKRAHFYKILLGKVSYGYCASKDQKYLELKGHLLINSVGIIRDYVLTESNVSERAVAQNFIELLERVNTYFIYYYCKVDESYENFV